MRPTSFRTSRRPLRISADSASPVAFRSSLRISRSSAVRRAWMYVSYRGMQHRVEPVCYAAVKNDSAVHCRGRLRILTSIRRRARLSCEFWDHLIFWGSPFTYSGARPLKRGRGNCVKVQAQTARSWARDSGCHTTVNRMERWERSGQPGAGVALLRSPKGKPQ